MDARGYHGVARASGLQSLKDSAAGWILLAGCVRLHAELVFVPSIPLNMTLSSRVVLSYDNGINAPSIFLRNFSVTSLRSLRLLLSF
jgi:hypothetical protein